VTRIWNIKSAAGQLLNEGRQALLRTLSSRRRSDRRPSASVDDMLRQLRRVGFVVLPGFLSPERSAELVRRIDDGLTRYAPFVQVDASGSDHRLFGLDAVDDEVRQVAFDPRALNVLTRYQDATDHEGFALCARLVAKPGNVGSGQGWHRDSAAFMQTKCMVYLSDVGPDNGPFQFVTGSHRPLDVVRCAGRYGFGVNQYRFSDDAIAELLAAEPSRVRTLTASAGTAILFDSRGLHRGTPIVAGQRYAITTYLWFNQPAPSHIRAWTIESQQRNGPMRGEVSYAPPASVT